MKSYHEKILSKELAWDKKSFSKTDTFSGPHCLTEKDILRELISKMKNGKTVQPSKFKSSQFKQDEHDNKPNKPAYM